MKGASLFLFVMFFLGCGSSDNGEINNGVNTTILSVYGTSGSASGVTVSDGYAYVDADDQGPTIIDVSDPAQFRLAGTCQLPGDIEKVCAAGNIAYLTAGEAGRIIVAVCE